MAYPFLKKLNARLECLMTYAIGQLCITTMVNPTARTVFPYVKIPYVKKPTLVLNRDLKQARTATAVNKQLNFTVKNKPHTTNYIYCIFEAYFMIKSA